MATAVCVPWGRLYFNALVIVFVISMCSSISSAADIDVGAYRRFYCEGDANSHLDNAWAAEARLVSDTGLFMAAQVEFTAVHYWHQRLNDLTLYGAGVGYEYSRRKPSWITPTVWGMVGYYWPSVSQCPIRRRYPEPVSNIDGCVFSYEDYAIHSGVGFEAGVSLKKEVSARFRIMASLSYRWLRMSERFSARLADGSILVIDQRRDFGGTRVGLLFQYSF